jgi:cyclase
LILKNGADKISINSPALANPELITTLNRQFGQQCVVIGIDSFFDVRLNDYVVKQYTGDPDRTRTTSWRTRDWVLEAQSRGAGEIVLNCMNQDGMRQGYDIEQLAAIRDSAAVPLIASGGAGALEHFRDVFQKADVDGALAASVFHKGIIPISELKNYLIAQGVEIRP